jgi:hypothetical protein
MTGKRNWDDPKAGMTSNPGRPERRNAWKAGTTEITELLAAPIYW